MKPKQQWWAEQSRDIADKIQMIAAQVDDPLGDKGSLDKQLRDLRAALNAFEALCRKRASRREVTKHDRRIAASLWIMQEFRRERGTLTKIAAGIGVNTASRVPVESRAARVDAGGRARNRCPAPQIAARYL